ncbi:MAG: hypothetical protein GX130_08170 [Candidatus Hydrogenedens sp.]|jgi:arylformamidase|nr:hypothetical protein [Candidatus Hydrogenedens sp.]
MEASWIDITRPMHEGMTPWPGDPVFSLEPDVRISQGDSCNVSRLTLGTHTGTHLDAPWHFMEEGKQLEEVDPRVFFGPALVIEHLSEGHIQAEDLPDEKLPERILFKTRNSEQPADSPFQKDFIALTENAARRLAADGVKLVGIDSMSIDPYKGGGRAHRILLGAGMVIVEGLQLAQVKEGEHEFIVLPLRLLHADGAPCRAFIRPA